MRRLTGLDAGWLYLDTDETPQHVGVVNIFASSGDADFDPAEATRAQFASRVPLIEPLRRRLVEVPLGLGHPYWVMDPEFDLDAHIHHHVAPRPDDESLEHLVAAIMTPPLDRSRPLWEAHVVTGLPDEAWAVVTKYHHATIDGGAGILLARLLFDADPDARPVVPERLVPDAEPIPGDVGLLLRSTVALADRQRRLLGLPIKMARHVGAKARADGLRAITASVASAARSTGSGSSTTGIRPQRAAPTPWNTSVAAGRSFAYRSLPMADLIALKNATGGTINDVVLTACAGGLRRYLVAHGALTDRPLAALVPVSRRTGDEVEPWKNLISVILTTLPTDEADPEQRFVRTQQSMASAKRQLDLVPGEALDDLVELIPASLASAAAQLSSRLRLTDRVGAVANLTISNVAGPREPRYLAGARLTRLTPVSLLSDGMGLNITVLSCGDRIDLGLTGCARSIPDIGVLRDGIVDELSELYELHGVQPSEPIRQGGSGAA